MLLSQFVRLALVSLLWTALAPTGFATSQIGDPQPDVCVYGFWDPPFDHGDLGAFTPPRLPGIDPLENFNAIHMALIPKGDHRGKVVVWDNGRNNNEDMVGLPGWIQRWAIVDATADPPDFENQEIILNAHDWFCAGHAWDSDGNLCLAGGTKSYNTASQGWVGSNHIWIYEPDAGQFGAWSNDQPDMAKDRWYPTVTLAGRDSSTPFHDHFVLAGSNKEADWNEFETLEYLSDDPSTPGTRGGPHPGPNFLPTQLGDDLVIYPRLTLLSTGNVFRSGMSRWPATLLPNGTWNAGDPSNSPYNRLYGTSVLAPITLGGQKDLIYVFGGEALNDERQPQGFHLDTSQSIQADAGTPAWADLASMTYARTELNSVLLPNGQVVLFGGQKESYPQTIKPELYKPGQDSWKVLAAGASVRNYHSTALLLPSGKVLTAGGDDRQWDYQVFTPPVLLCNVMTDPRPEITSFPQEPNDQLGYDDTEALIYEGNVAKVVLQRPGSVTHHTDYDQRQIELSFVDTPPSLTFTTPSDPNLAPPGYYMLFIVSNSGKWSEAEWIRLR